MCKVGMTNRLRTFFKNAFKKLSPKKSPKKSLHVYFIVSFFHAFGVTQAAVHVTRQP